MCHDNSGQNNCETKAQGNVCKAATAMQMMKQMIENATLGGALAPVQGQEILTDTRIALGKNYKRPVNPYTV